MPSSSMSDCYKMPSCVHSVLTGLFGPNGLPHSAPTHMIGSGAQSAPTQFGSSGLGNRIAGVGAMPPCCKVWRRASSESFGSSVSRLLTTGSPLTTLTRYRKFVPLPAEQVTAAFESGENATKNTESSNVIESVRIFWFDGIVNFQPRSPGLITTWVWPLTSIRSLSETTE